MYRQNRTAKWDSLRKQWESLSIGQEIIIPAGELLPASKKEKRSSDADKIRGLISAHNSRLDYLTQKPIRTKRLENGDLRIYIAAESCPMPTETEFKTWAIQQHDFHLDLSQFDIPSTVGGVLASFCRELDIPYILGFNVLRVNCKRF